MSMQPSPWPDPDILRDLKRFIAREVYILHKSRPPCGIGADSKHGDQTDERFWGLAFFGVSARGVRACRREIRKPCARG